MSIYKKLFAVLTAFSMLFSIAACSADKATENNAPDQSSAITDTPDKSGDLSETGTATSSENIDIEFAAKDLESGYDETDATKITLDGSDVAVKGDGAVFTNNVLTISAKGTYIVSGTLSDGRILINAGEEDKVKLVLDNANISCSNYAPIFISQADKVYITLVGENTLTDAATYALGTDDSNVDATIFSRADLTLNGSGTLNITASYKHGICSKDDLVIGGGTYDITAVGGGFYGKDCVKIASGIFTFKTESDGIQSNNAEDEGRGFVYIKDGTFNITAETDGIQAETVLRIDGGVFTITTGGGSQNASTKEGQDNPGWGAWGGTRGPQNPQPSSPTPTTDTASAKGLKSASELIVNGGTFILDTSDDSLHSNNALTVDGGTFTITSGDDGLHSDTTFLINNGNVTITKSYEGIESAAITIAGGTIDLTSSDDGFNAAGGNDNSSVSGRPGQGRFSTSTGTMTLSGGTVKINATGDGIDCNGPITMTGGSYLVFGPTRDDNGPMDYDGEFVCNGGTLIALGSAGMAQGVSSGSNAWMLVKMSGAANSVLKVTDSNSNVVCEITSPKVFASVLIASPDLKSGTNYTFYINGTSAGTKTAS